jgi:hypothetical protein
MHISVVAIEGDHLQEIGEILKKCKYDIEKSYTVRTGNEASRAMGKSDANRVAKVAYFTSGWTTIVDPELVLFTNDEIWEANSRKWNNRVIGWLSESASGSYGLTLFQSGKKQREVVSVDGEVKVDKGTPLPEESGVNWSDASAREVLEVAKRFGAIYDFLADREYTVFQLNESQMGGSK